MRTAQEVGKKSKKMKFLVEVDMHPMFDASMMNIALIGMMVKVVKVEKVRQRPKGL